VVNAAPPAVESTDPPPVAAPTASTEEIIAAPSQESVSYYNYPVDWSTDSQIVVDDIDQEFFPEPVAVEAKAASSPTPKAKAKATESNTEEEEEVEVKKTENRPKMLGERLVEKGLISQDQLDIALKEQTQQAKNGDRSMLGAVLVSMGFITESALGGILAETTGIQHIDILSGVLDPNLVIKIPKEVAARHKILPVSQDGDTISVATPDVYNILAMDQAHKYFPAHYKIIPVYTSEADLMDAIEQYYGYEMSVGGILKEIETGQAEKAQLSGEVEGYINPTVRLVDALLIDAIKRGASDIHFEPESFFLRLRYRIDGQMIQVRSFHKDYWPAISVRIKIVSGMNIAETRVPQDGRISYNVLGREIDFRVATQPTVHGENIVMRILDKKKSLVPMEDLGYSANNIRLLRKMLKRPEGIIIVTGPTGSGKTTSLYSMLNYINDISVNIMTLEDPVEYQLPLIRQSQVREGTAMDFVNGIKSLMRQDPDIVFIGEIRDEPTANMAIRAAMTGHQVFSTLHTNDALGAIPRLIDIGIPPHLLSGALTCMIAQRLARTLCKHCKEAYAPSPEECKILGIPAENPPQIYRHKGCEKCYGCGYKGRVSITEILPIDREFDDLIAMGATRRSMFDHALSKGFVPMVDDGIGKILAGVTDIAELINTIDMTSRLE
jgi:general secretion pathway protein E/type IV pilus assembly protein PilB